MTYWWFTIPKKGIKRMKYKSLFRGSTRIWDVGYSFEIKAGDHLILADPMKLIDIFKIVNYFPPHAILNNEPQTMLWHHYYGPIPLPKWKYRDQVSKIDFPKKKEAVKRECSAT